MSAPTERAPDDGGAAPYYSDDRATVYVGDCRDVLPHLAPVDTVITDPPYGLTANKRGGSGMASVNLDSPYGRARIGTGNGGGFMGKRWDAAVPGPEFWTAVAGAVKPGASLLAFGGTRTWHRLACAVEGAGWEIRDCLMWLYGTGFPKSHNLGGEFDGWGTALKPAWEPIILAMRPLDGTFVENALRHGVAGLNIDGARIGGTVETWPTSRAYSRHDTGSPNKATQEAGPVPAGRWPANLLLDEDAAELLDEQAGLLTSGGTPPGGVRTSSPTYNAHNGVRSGSWPADHGLASRFFYCSKASRAERGDGNNHPTVKPLDLLRYLCRLTATPTGGTVLDPFMGSGSTLIAALREGRRAIGIDVSEEYAEIAVRRIQAEPLALDFGGAA